MQRLPRRPAVAGLLILGLALGGLALGELALGTGVAAQDAAPGGLPGGGHFLTPGPVGSVGSPSAQVTAAANDHGSYLWIVDPAQHAVVLCAQSGGGKDFSCNRKPLP